VVDRATLEGTRIVNSERLFKALPYYKEPNHFGCRLLLKNGFLFITMGERYFLRDSAQTLSNHLGKVLRINEDGSIPGDNPFIGNKGALPEIWSYGHRNPQGLILNPLTDEVWEHEHGPKGGDEINIIRPTLNYGWPVICHGIDYDGTPIGEGITQKDGMEQPLYYYVPSIAPSGMEFYTADEMPQWKGNLFIGAMALTHLNRLVLEGNKVIKEDRLLAEKKWRIRCVRQGPDGFLYIGVDKGRIHRIKPKD
jgi:glucose/arabinose dehydrogenase